MGAKTALKLRARGTAFKCHMCGRKLMSMEALISHERTAHNIITRRNKSKQVTEPLKATKKEVKQKPAKKESSPLKIRQKIKFSESISEPEESEDKSLPKRKTVEFKCPKCFRAFASYLPAHKHIQNFHCVNRQGVKVPPNSPSLIQPIRIEFCNNCNRKVKSIQNHICKDDNKAKMEDQLIICTACDDWMPNMKAFGSHVLNAHGDNVDSMFFPVYSEFIKWKIEMEAQTGVNYILEKYDSKRYYHCNFVKDNDKKMNTTSFCPSTIVVQEFPKGIQVHFFKQHYKHEYIDYTIMEEYKKYNITSFLKRSEEYNNLKILPSDGNDLYLQFKSLMEGIIVDAAKINVPTLKILLGKALDMTSVLTNYDEEVEENDVIVTSVANVTHMTETQITKALETTNLTFGKRKNNVNTDVSSQTQTKKIKQDSVEDMSPKILNSFSLAHNKSTKNDKSDTDNKKSDDDIDKSKQNNKKNTEWDPYSSSFNDSYKDFVVKNFPVVEADIKKKARKRPGFLTKMGQFKPNTLPKSHKTQEESKAEVKEKTPVRTSFDKPNIDIKYEVKEQDEGCNILILKL
ncbi:unnamed protein product, partial [Brenthis ino]